MEKIGQYYTKIRNNFQKIADIHETPMIEQILQDYNSFDPRNIKKSKGQVNLGNKSILEQMEALIQNDDLSSDEHE